MTLYDSNYDAVYYGTTPNGKRIHLASTVFYQRSKRVYMAQSFCGNNIDTYEEGQVPPYRVSEFCRSCFRTLAWAIFEAEMLQHAPELTLLEANR